MLKGRRTVSDEDKKKNRKAYEQRSEVKARRKELAQRPEVKEKNRKNALSWRQKNRDRVNATARRFYQNHREKLLKKAKIRNENLSPAERKIARIKRKFHEAKTGYGAKYYQKNKDKINVRARTTNSKVKNEVLTHYSKSDSPECVCCGENSNLIFLTLDHITSKKQMGHNQTDKGFTFYRKLQRADYPKGYQTLCWNCNCSKRDYGICAHQRSLK